MSHLRGQLIQVVDNYVAYLAQRSRELDQETRVSVYTFDDRVKCAIYDKDALRLPSIRDHYQIGGRTALIDATLKSLDDLAQTAQLYGDHAFLIYVFTDGANNVNSGAAPRLASRLDALPDNWTVACFVPNQTGVFEAKKFGFPANNIAVWDVSAKGLDEVGETVRRTTDTYMRSRASGVRGSRNLFSMGVDALNPQTVQQAHLQRLPPSAYRIVSVPHDAYIRDFVESHVGTRYVLGNGYYELMKSEMIQAGKQVAVQEIATGNVYTGREARSLIGLDARDERVRPDRNPLFKVYVQSTSTNRKLIKGTTLLLLN